MDEEWMNDARKIPDEVMDYLRKIAVRAVEENDYSPELIADVLGISRTAIYGWLRRYQTGGYQELESKQAPGASPKITEEMDNWLYEAVLGSTPLDFGYDTGLWTQKILAEILSQIFDVEIGVSTVGFHLRKLEFSYQKPWFRASERDDAEVRYFLDEKFPRIQRLAEKLGADIGFEDESGVGLQTHSGKTWGKIGETPEVPLTAKRGGYNLLSIVTPEGELRFSIQDSKIDSTKYIEFLRKIIQRRKHPIILVVDRASFHHSKKVRQFVRLHRKQIRIYFLPAYAPEMNPDEQVWNAIKSKKIGKMVIKNKEELKKALYSALRKLQSSTDMVRSFFKLPATKYAAI